MAMPKSLKMMFTAVRSAKASTEGKVFIHPEKQAAGRTGAELRSNSKFTPRQRDALAASGVQQLLSTCRT